jgi:hypothetical protein
MPASTSPAIQVEVAAITQTEQHENSVFQVRVFILVLALGTTGSAISLLVWAAVRPHAATHKLDSPYSLRGRLPASPRSSVQTTPRR